MQIGDILLFHIDLAPQFPSNPLFPYRILVLNQISSRKYNTSADIC